MLLMGKSTVSMVIFNSYVKLPEGNMYMSIYVHLWTWRSIRECANMWCPPLPYRFFFGAAKPHTSPAWCSLKLVSETHPRNGSNWWLVGDLFHERWSDWSQNGRSEASSWGPADQTTAAGPHFGDGKCAAFGLFCQLPSGKSKVAMENPRRFRWEHP